MMNKTFLVCGIGLAMLSVILGAFAAHGLKARISTELLGAFQTGVQYQFYHALALMLLAVIMSQMSSSLLNVSGGFLLAGVLLFSGSLYALALTGIKWFGPVTPIGGVCFIIGWLLMLVAVVKDS